jgi:hypothetical protein
VGSRGLHFVSLHSSVERACRSTPLLHAATGALGMLAAKTTGRKPQKSDFSAVHLRPLASLLPPRSLLQRFSGWLEGSTTQNYLHAGHK